MEENKLFLKLNIQRFASHLTSWDSYYVVSGGSSPYGSYDFKGEVRAYLESQSIANNTSYIRLDHYIYRNRTNTTVPLSYVESSYRVCGPLGCTGYSMVLKRNITAGGYHLLGSTYHTVSHDSNGGGTFTVNGSIYGILIYTSGGVEYDRSTNFYITLPTIPRYANITGFSVWNNGLSQIGVSWSADKSIDGLQYSLNGGGWIDIGGGTFYISGLSPNTQYSVKIRVRAADSQLWTESSTQYATTTQVNQITSNNPVGNSDTTLNVTANNPSGNRNDIKLEFPDLGLVEVLRKDNTLNATFTVAEMESIADLIPNVNSTKLRATAVTVINGVDTYWNYKDGTYTVINANPTFSNFEYADINTATTDLTGNNQTIIKGYSNLRTRVSTSNKMIANKGATAKEYQLVVGSKQIKADYHASNNVDLVLNGIDNNVFIVYAIDSRGNSVAVQKSPSTYVDYFKPAIIATEYGREEDIGTETTLKFNGSFFNANFGIQNNTLTATYKYKRTNSDEWIDGTTSLTLITDGNNYSCDQLIAGDLGANGFNAENSYDLEIVVTDKLESVANQFVIDSGKPNMAFAKEGVAINSLYDETKGSGMQISGNKIIFNGLTLFEWIDE